MWRLSREVLGYRCPRVDERRWLGIARLGASRARSGPCCGHAYEPERAGARPHGPGHCRCEPTAEDEVAFLKEEADGLRHYLEGIERRISELQKTSG